MKKSLLFLLVCMTYGAASGVSIPPSGLKLWLRADAGVTSSGGLVSAWADQSGNGNDASQGTATYQPTVVSNSLNGLPVIHFDGNYNMMVLPTSTDLGIQSSPYEFFIVARPTADATYGHVYFLLSGGSYEQFEYHLVSTGNARFIPNSGNYLDKSGDYTDGAAHIFAGRASSTGGSVRVDGVDGAVFTSDLTSSDTGNLCLGARQFSTFFFNGDIAEVIVYNRVLSPSERTQVEQYLATRYNVTDMPLAVQATEFLAKDNNGSVTLSWKTGSEVDNAGFNVLRQDPGIIAFKLLSSYSSNNALKGMGTSSNGRSYSFTDANVKSGSTYQYKVQSVSTNGTTKDLTTLSVTVDVPKDYALYQNYPNPFNPSTRVRFDLKVGSTVTIEVYNILGQKVMEQNYGKMNAGRYDEVFGMDNFSSGVYYYRINAVGDDGQKFASVKKLILMK